MRQVYLTPLGGVGIVLPAPRPGMERSPDDRSGAHELLNGGWAVDRAANAARTWDMKWTWDTGVQQQLYALMTGQLGRGPYALHEPAIRNYLTAQQASSTQAWLDTSGFSASGGETLTSSTVLPFRGSRSLSWSLPAAVSSGILSIVPPGGLLGWPTPPISWTLSGVARLLGADTSINIRPVLRWLDATGTLVSDSAGAYVNATTGGWISWSVAAAPPATGRYLLPRLQVDPATVTATTTVFVDSLQLAPTSVWSATWQPGEGPAVVSITNLGDTVQMATPARVHRDVSVKLAQLAVG